MGRVVVWRFAESVARISCGTLEVSQVSKADSTDCRGEGVARADEVMEMLRRMEAEMRVGAPRGRVRECREIMELVFPGD